MIQSARFRKIDSTIVGWKTKIEDSENYQKTKHSLNEGGKKASNAITSAATSIRYICLCVCMSSDLSLTETARLLKQLVQKLVELYRVLVQHSRTQGQPLETTRESRILEKGSEALQLESKY